MREAIDLLLGKLRRELRQLAEVYRARRAHTGVSGPHAWRHGDLAETRPERYPRPAEERELVRRKTYALHEQTVAEAALEMDLLDHDWHLFTESETGVDAVVERLEDGLRLHVPGLEVPTGEGVPPGVEVAVGVPRRGVDEALAVLDATDALWHAFVDEDTGRGAVAYLRYDGHYGLVTAAPREEPPPAGEPAGTARTEEGA